MKPDMRSGVFLDRDGTINREVGYLENADQVELLPGSGLAIRLLNGMGIPVVIISNQSGIGRGYVRDSWVEEAHVRLRMLLTSLGAHIDAIHYCPHTPDDGCECRKPRPGLLREAAQTLGLRLESSYMIGDRDTDIATIHGVGGKGILVLSGYGNMDQWEGPLPDFIAQDLLEAVYWIMIEEKRREPTMAISKELLDILACPKCKGEVHLTEKGDGLVCSTCKCVYPIRDDIPVMLIDEAVPYQDERP